MGSSEYFLTHKSDFNWVKVLYDSELTYHFVEYVKVKESTMSFNILSIQIFVIFEIIFTYDFYVFRDNVPTEDKLRRIWKIHPEAKWFIDIDENTALNEETLGIIIDLHRQIQGVNLERLFKEGALTFKEDRLLYKNTGRLLARESRPGYKRYIEKIDNEY